MTKKQPLTIRWVKQEDLTYILDIDIDCFSCPWEPSDFETCLEDKAIEGILAQKKKMIVGFMFYRFKQEEIELLSLAVKPRFHGEGIGTRLLQKLIQRTLTVTKCKRIYHCVAESNLPAQLFLKKNGFIATDIVSKPFIDTGSEEDGYLMEYSP